jgi:hypothetical protein
LGEEKTLPKGSFSIITTENEFFPLKKINQLFFYFEKHEKSAQKFSI